MWGPILAPPLTGQPAQPPCVCLLIGTPVPYNDRIPPGREGLAIPDMPDALVRHGRIDAVLGNRSVPHKDLQRPGINAATRKGIAGRVP
jgi:hypothetical protein